MGKHKAKVKDRRFKPTEPAPTPIPVHERCIFEGPTSWATRCSHRAELRLVHEEFESNELAGLVEQQYCLGHIGYALAELIEAGCGIDELTILRYPFFQVTT